MPDMTLDPAITDPMPPDGTKPLVSTPTIWRSHEYANGQAVEYDFERQVLTVESPPWAASRSSIVIPLLRIVEFRVYDPNGYASFHYLPRARGFRPQLRGHTMALNFEVSPDGSYSSRRSTPRPPPQFHAMALDLRTGVTAKVARAELENLGYQPVGRYPGHYSPWAVRCNMGHSLEPLPLPNLLYIGDAQDRWCHECRREFRDMAVWVYLMRSGEQMKIGISNAPELRKEALGPTWDIVDTSGPWPRSAALSVETDVLRALRTRGIPLGGDAWDEPFDGSHETWPASAFEPESLGDLAEALDLPLEW